MRTSVRDTQLVEQLVEVPTIISFSSLQRTMEQHVDIPVPRRGDQNDGLQGFLPEQSSTATHSSEKRISERIVEQIVDIPGGDLQSFRPEQSSPSSSHFQGGVHEGLDESGEGFFRTFTMMKKVRRSPDTRVRGCTPVSAHPRWRLSSWMRPCRTPSSGCSSVTAASPLTGTDALMRLAGSRCLASTWSGSARGLGWEGSGTGTGSPVPVVTLFPLCLLSDGRRGEGDAKPLNPSWMPPRPFDHAAEVPAVLPVHVLAVHQIQFTIRVPGHSSCMLRWPRGGANCAENLRVFASAIRGATQSTQKRLDKQCKKHRLFKVYV